VPPLEPGDHLDQKTFHARYEAMPEDFRAELIGGIVYMPSPVKLRHGEHHALIVAWLVTYQEGTPEVKVFDNTTNILSDDSELEPDACLLILPEKGGQTWVDEEGYLCGAPELVVEVASSSEAIDLHAKKRDYEKAGVLEYLVVALRQQRVFWFQRRRGKFTEMTPGTDGIFRSEVFPGLWLDAAALLRKDTRKLLAGLRQGLASPQHGAFVKKLTSK
jgi:Uma2 family endonuclease